MRFRTLILYFIFLLFFFHLYLLLVCSLSNVVAIVGANCGSDRCGICIQCFFFNPCVPAQVSIIPVAFRFAFYRVKVLLQILCHGIPFVLKFSSSFERILQCEDFESAFSPQHENVEFTFALHLSISISSIFRASLFFQYSLLLAFDLFPLQSCKFACIFIFVLFLLVQCPFHSHSFLSFTSLLAVDLFLLKSFSFSVLCVFMFSRFVQSLARSHRRRRQCPRKFRQVRHTCM